MKGHNKLECYDIFCQKIASNKHSSLFGPLLSYEENGVLWIWLQWLYSKHFIFLVIYEWAQ
jgi:hypothetical protein